MSGSPSSAAVRQALLPTTVRRHLRAALQLLPITEALQAATLRPVASEAPHLQDLLIALQDLLIALRDLHTAHPVHHLHHQAIAVLQAAEAIPAAHPEAAAVIPAADTQVAEALTQVVAVPIPAADPMAAPEGSSSVTLNSTRT